MSEPNLPPPIVIPYAQPAWQLPFRDRRTGLTAYGVVIILFGALAGCTTVAMPFSLVAMAVVPGSMPGGRGSLVAAVIGGTLMYAAVTTALLWLGIGSTRCHRYVRPCILTLAWLSIAFTVVGVISSIGASSFTRAVAGGQFVSVTVPAATQPGTAPAQSSIGGVRVQDFSENAPVDAVEPTTRQAAPNGTVAVGTAARSPRVRVTPVPLPGPVATGLNIAVVMMSIMFAVVAIAIAGLFIWFYGSEDTRLTMEFFDPRPRWTDGRPAPVIGIVIVLAVIGLSAPVVLLQQSAMLLSSENRIGMLAAVGLYGLCAALALLSVVPVYRQRPAGWWMAIGVALLCAAGGAAAFWYGDPVAYMRQWGVIEADALRDVMRQQQRWQIVAATIWMLAAMGYLLWARRFFRPATVPN